MPHDDLVSNNLKNPDYCSVFGPLRQWWWTLNVISWVLGGVHLKTGVMWRLQGTIATGWQCKCRWRRRRRGRGRERVATFR